MVEMYLREARKNLELLSEQVGKPAVKDFPQTTNQAIVRVLEDVLSGLENLRLKVLGLEYE